MSRATQTAVLSLLLVLAACSGVGEPAPGERPAEPSGPPSPEAEPAEPTPSERASAAECGNRPSDWCASPSSDPCRVHHDASACSGDPRCEGRPYSGESVVACQLDARCFAANCPTVGCVQRCEELSVAACRAAAPRCSVEGARCVRREPCLSTTPPQSENEDVPAQVDS